MTLTQLQLYHKSQGCSFEWRQIVLVDWHHQWHQLSFQSVQDSHSLAHPYLSKCYLDRLWLIVILMIPTSQAHKCFWRIISPKDFREINSLESDFSIDSGFVPLNSIIHVIQFERFLNYLTIKFGEYYHQRNCGVLFIGVVAPDKLPFPVPLSKNSSSAGRMGRVLSIGIQYL